MKALLQADVESRRRREEMLRELNLYPLWQLRRESAVAAAAEQTPRVTADSAAIPVLRDEEAVTAEIQQPDIASLDWMQLKHRVRACNACKLRGSCTQTIFGMGDEHADWLFVGSWPNEEDETAGIPFAGPAGQLLDNMLAAIGLRREANVYIANLIKCSSAGHGSPQLEELAQCAPYLARQIQLLQPRMIVALGHDAARALLGAQVESEHLSGKVHQYQAGSVQGALPAIALVVTHHPVELLLTPQKKAQSWHDLRLARDLMRSM